MILQLDFKFDQKLKKIKNMGTINCTNCCHEKLNYPEIQSRIKTHVFLYLILRFFPDINHQINCEPNQKFAKPVKQVIELNSTVKEIYKKHRYHQTNRNIIGTRLQPYYIFQKNAYYEGEWKSGLPNGNGRLYYDNGCFFEGEFEDGVPSCQNGLFIQADGSFYKGQISNSQANGIGIYQTKNLHYEGQFKDNKPDGRGQQKIITGQYFIGNFSKGHKNGYGKFIWNDKSSYTGNFVNGLMEGIGILTNQQYVYTGEFKQNKKNGKGEIIYVSGDIYTGNFENDKIEGEGKYIWKTGQIYQGKFHEGKQHGMGKFYSKSKKVKIGQWKMGKFMRESKKQQIDL